MRLIAAALLLPLCLACPRELRHERREVRTMALKEGGEFRLKSFNGAIHVTTWDKPEVEVEALIREHNAGEVKLVSEAQPDLALFRAERLDAPSDSWELFSRSASVRLMVRVPKKARGVIETSNGALSVSDLEGSVDARTSNGKVEVHTLGGNLTVHTSNGAIIIEKVTGTVEAATSNGSFEVTDLGGKATLRTSNGRITMTDVKGPVRASTSHGSIRASRIMEDLTAETSNGRIELQDVLGMVDVSSSNGSIEARGLDGKGRGIKMRTSNASITVTLGAAKGEVIARTSHGRVSVAQKEALTQDSDGAYRARIGDSNQRIELLTTHSAINID